MSLSASLLFAMVMSVVSPRRSIREMVYNSTMFSYNGTPKRMKGWSFYGGKGGEGMKEEEAGLWMEEEEVGGGTMELVQLGAERTKNVLILMSDTGGGHRASAEAIRDAFRLEFGDEYRVRNHFSNQMLKNFIVLHFISHVDL